jgi:hypothetical protein
MAFGTQATAQLPAPAIVAICFLGCYRRPQCLLRGVDHFRSITWLASLIRPRRKPTRNIDVAISPPIAIDRVLMA